MVSDLTKTLLGVDPNNILGLKPKNGVSFGGNHIDPLFHGGKVGIEWDFFDAFNKDAAQKPTGTPPHLQFSFDTIGQTIMRSFGHCRLPLKTLWIQGIVNQGDNFPLGATTYTFAAALCAPFDPSEEGIFNALYDGNDVLYTPEGGIVPPEGWDPTDQEALIEALTGAVIYPGDEAQEPDPLILADRGAEAANAFRGLRYIVIPGYPLRPPPSVLWTRTNAAGNARAVLFAEGTG